VSHHGCCIAPCPVPRAQGKWKGIGIITSVITLGVLVVYIGVSTASYGLTLFGRVLYGLGGESVYVGVDILVTKWFAGEPNHAAVLPLYRNTGCGVTDSTLQYRWRLHPIVGTLQALRSALRTASSKRRRRRAPLGPSTSHRRC